MRRTILSFSVMLVASALAFCSSPTGVSGPLAFGIVSGNHQVVTAGSDSLLSPVVGQAYEDQNGNVAFRFGPAPLLAQTKIGTGIPNILTCAEPTGAHGLVPYVDCAQTNGQGFVTFWFQPGTVATDSSCAEIRATPHGKPAVLATTCSQVKPGDPYSSPIEPTPFDEGWYSGWINGAADASSKAFIRMHDKYGNDVPWTLSNPTGQIALVDSVTIRRTGAGDGTLDVTVDGFGTTTIQTRTCTGTAQNGYAWQTFLYHAPADTAAFRCG